MIIPITHSSKGTHNLLIDDEDYDLIKDYNWCLNINSNRRTIYARATIYHNCKYVKRLNIHRVIMGLDDYKRDRRVVNHINGNGLDNRRCNLEICNSLYNSQSIRKPRQKFGMVYKDNSMKRIKRWTYSVKIIGKTYRKRFVSREEAVKGLCMKELIEKTKQKNLFPLLN